MQVKKQQLELDMEQQTGSKSGNEYTKAVYCHPAYLTYMQSASWEKPDWIIIKTARRNINNLIYADDTTLMAESEEKLKNLLMNMKEETEKVSLKLNIHKTKIMASHHFMADRWGNSGNSGRLFLVGEGSKITADGDCSHEIKRCLLLGRKVMTNLDGILKSRDVTLPIKVHLKVWFF